MRTLSAHSSWHVASQPDHGGGRSFSFPAGGVGVGVHQRKFPTLSRSRAVQHVVIRFRADQVPFITERIWHSSPRITPQNDGGIVFEMDIADLGEVSRWLRGFGASAEVLQPTDLRKQFVSELKSALGAYRCAGSDC